MLLYNFRDIETDIQNTIKSQVSLLCKNNKINQEKQNYHILFTDEILTSNYNDVFFVSGSKKFCSFYGRVYGKLKNNVKEIINVGEEKILVDIKDNSSILIFGGTESSTLIQGSEDCISFYIAPGHLIQNNETGNWKML